MHIQPVSANRGLLLKLYQQIGFQQRNTLAIKWKGVTSLLHYFWLIVMTTWARAKQSTKHGGFIWIFVARKCTQYTVTCNVMCLFIQYSVSYQEDIALPSHYIIPCVYRFTKISVIRKQRRERKTMYLQSQKFDLLLCNQFEGMLNRIRTTDSWYVSYVYRWLLFGILWNVVTR